MIGTSRELRVSQSYFNPLLLPFYDALVFGFVSKYLWGHPVEALVERYRHLMSDRHLEVGVGTGYLLDRAGPPPGIVLDLMDLSASCLRRSKQRLSRYQPATFRHNVLQPCTGVRAGYRSIAVNYVMHCVPGSYGEKAIAFRHLKGLLADDGVLFGTAVMGKKARAHRAAKLFLTLLNGIGIFNNAQDEPADLEQGLRHHFKHVEVEVIGATARFFATDDPLALERALNFNWGSPGVEPLRAVVEHPTCDRATVMSVFALAAPDSYEAQSAERAHVAGRVPDLVRHHRRGVDLPARSSLTLHCPLLPLPW